MIWYNSKPMQWHVVWHIVYYMNYLHTVCCWNSTPRRCRRCSCVDTGSICQSQHYTPPVPSHQQCPPASEPPRQSRPCDMPVSTTYKLNTSTATVSWPLYRSTCVGRHLQSQTRGFCWCKVLLPTSPCWQQPAHSDHGKDARVLLNSTIYTVSVPSTF